MAVADPAPGAAERLAAGLGAGSAYTDPAQAFADPAVDAVVIAAPARFHADLIVAAAAEAGKAVFCEKPAALSLGDLDRAIEAVAGRRGGAAGRVQPPVRPGLGGGAGVCSTTGRWARRGCCAR